MRERGVIVGVVAQKSDRLWRDLEGELTDRKKILKWNRPIVTRDGVYDTRKGITAEKRLATNIQAAVNAWYREQVAPKVKDTAMKKAEKGERPGGRIPFGYRLPEKKKPLVIREDEAKQVRAIFDRFLAKENLHSVCMEMNEAGCRNRQGAHWNIWSLKRILGNPIYVGDLVYNVREKGKRRPASQHIVTQNAVPPIVSRATFEAAQRLRADITKAYPPRSQRSPYLLSGLVFCHCGSRMQGHKNNTWCYYRCYDGQHKGKTACPTQTWIRSDKLEDVLVEALFGLRLNPQELRRRLSQTNQDRRKDLPRLRRRIGHLEGQLTKLNGRAEQIKDAYEDRAYSLAEMKRRLAKAQQEITEVETALAQAYAELEATEASTTNVDFAVQCLEHAFDEYQAKSFPERQVLIRQLIDRVVVNDQRSGYFTVRHLDKLYIGKAGDQPFTVRPQKQRRKGVVSPKLLAALYERSGYQWPGQDQSQNERERQH